MLRPGGNDPAKPFTPAKPVLKPDAPARMMTRFESKETSAAFKALDLLAKMPGAKLCGGMVELNGKRMEGDYLSLRFGPGIAIDATDIDTKVKELTTLLAVAAPIVSLRLDTIGFPSGRDMTNFCDAFELDFERVEWKQD